MSDLDTFLGILIQRTPHIDILTKQLRRKGFPSIKHERVVTQYLKARRLYDTLFQECLTYNESERDRLKKVFHDTGNGNAGEILFSVPNTLEFNSTKFWRETLDYLTTEQTRNIGHPQSQASHRITTASMLQIYGAAKVGNISKMETLMKGLATKCVLIHLPPDALSHGKRNLDKIIQERLDMFRTSLRNALLDKKDWSDKTLLHVAIDAKTLEGVNIILRYAQEARIKGALLDSKDAFGNSSLHLALRRKYVLMSRKLIFEGADVFLMNNKNEFPLQLIYQRFPKMALYLMDEAVTVSGDVSSDSLCLNIDFGVISTYIDFDSNSENRLQPIYFFRGNGKRKQLELRNSHVVRVDDFGNEHTWIPLVTHLPTSTSPTPSDNPYKQQLHRREDEMHVLASLVYNNEESCTKVLSHPVTRLFLMLKWNRMKYIIWTNASFRMAFYLIYLLVMFRIYFIDCPHTNCNSSVNDSFTATNGMQENRNETAQSKECNWSEVTLALLPVTIVLNILFLGGEILKMPVVLQVCKFKVYWFGYLGMGAWTRFVFFHLAILTSTTPYYQTQFQSYQYVIAIVGVLLGSILLLQVLGDSNLDFFIHSIYVHVYMKVMSRFLSVITTFSSIILGFAISFSIIFPQPMEFSTFGRSVFRLLIMIHGEFDFEDKSIKLNSDGDRWVFWSGQMLYVLFGSIVTLVLIDVFLGYTVSDIKELREQAENVRRHIQIQQIFILENFLLSLRKLISENLRQAIRKHFEFFVIRPERLKMNRSDVMIAFDELPETMKSEFRDFLTQS